MSDEYATATIIPADDLTAIVRKSDYDALRSLLTEAAGLLREAVEDIEHWADYADDYFRKKHGLAGDLERYRAALARIEGKP